MLFVINLCASTSPLALVHPSNPELKRYTFFVTRQREDGRERFRLHMGYFHTQDEAEVLLAAVRDVYPAAWAGPAPTSGGAPRRPRAVAPPPSPSPAAAPRATAPAPTPQAARPAKPASAPAAAGPARTPATPAPRSAPSEPQLDAMSNVRDVLAELSDETPRPIAAPPLVKRAPPPPARAAATPPTLAPRAAAPPRAPAATTPPPAPRPAPSAKPVSLSPAQALQLLESPPAPAPKPAAKPAARAPEPSIPDVPEGDSVRVVTPEDTQTLRDIRLDAERNAPPCFAVQLLWSVSPINAADHPHLAIFEAYTLYNVEGSRGGRRWYGLRLGFFKDPNAATQVAYYVRSDYPTVAVVPVAEKERDNAQGRSSTPVAAVSLAVAPPAVVPAATPRATPPAPAAKPRPAAAGPVTASPARQPQPPPSQGPRSGVEGFELLEDDRPPPIKRDVDDPDPDAAPKPQKPALTARPAKPADGKGPKATGKPSGKRVVVRKPAAPSRVTPGAAVPLEETLEILGASTLTLDESREIINDSAVRKKVDDKKKNGAGGRLSRLLNRLGGS